MSVDERRILEEVPWRFNTPRTEVMETPDGVEIRFICCGKVERFGLNGDPQIIGQTIIDHITKVICPKPKAAGAQSQFPRNPVAKTMADLVTPKQLVAIRAIANAHGVNAEAKCLELLKCRPEELSRKAASIFIDWLKEQRKNICETCGLDRMVYGWDEDYLTCMRDHAR